MKDLLESGAAPVSAKDTCRSGGLTPLHVAALLGKTEIVELLLLKGADKDVLDDDKCTPLHTALWYMHPVTALALITAGADVNLRWGESQTSVAHLACREKHTEVLKAAIEHGADVNAVDTYQRTHLDNAAGHNCVEAIDTLVKAGANIDVRCNRGGTPLHTAACGVRLEALPALLKHGAEVNPQNYDLKTPLHSAAITAGRQGAAKVVDSLLRSGTDETILNNEGKAAADVVGQWIELTNRYAQQWPELTVKEEDIVFEDIERTRELLANAPADRAWRRRGYLVLCRAHPDRMQQLQESSRAAPAPAGAAGSVCNSTDRTETEEGCCDDHVGQTAANGSTRGDGAGVVMVRVFGLREEDIFRKIVVYL